ncbi:MAG: Gfo/Idh/MocA family oxidoreductase [Planctomycetaceae bacterium]|jgi:predicted dehydrogenase|nr:Gfo/Idh/MocA family oxidoreductase [Planctomycetaceae bacterium]
MKTHQHTISRREFLRNATAVTTAGVVASPFLVPRHVLGDATQPGANDTVKVALIGLGGRCTGLYPHEIKPVAGLKVVAISDLVQPRIDSFMKRYAEDFQPEQGYTDFREMIEKEKPDGVMAITATHQRAWTSAIAMQMGCHLYIEKPMVLTISEGRYLVNAARKYNRVTQVGTQQRSLPLCLWACKQVQDGAIGKVKVVQAPNFVGPNIWTDQPGQPYPEGMNDEVWDRWTNQAELRPYHAQLFYNWSNWWDYDAGGLCFGVSGWGTHSYDQVNMVLGMNDTGPVEILLEEPCTIQDSGKFVTRKPTDEDYDPEYKPEDDTGTAYFGMAKVKGPRAKMKMWFANGVELRFNLDGDRGPGLGCIVTGENGKIEINRHKLSSNPKELAANMPEEFKNKRPETVYHVENWIDCIKTGKKCNADIEYGQRSTTLCELVNIVRATAPVGEKIGWDPVKERFTNNDKGNEMLSRPRRKGYELPELS